jgi:hypothetical protein
MPNCIARPSVSSCRQQRHDKRRCLLPCFRHAAMIHAGHLASGFTLGRRPLSRRACHKSHLACSVSQICASQRVRASNKSAVSALTARRPLTIALRRRNGIFIRLAASLDLRHAERLEKLLQQHLSRMGRWSVGRQHRDSSVIVGATHVVRVRWFRPTTWPHRTGATARSAPLSE